MIRPKTLTNKTLNDIEHKKGKVGDNRMHEIFQKQFSNFYELESSISKISDPLEKGRAFEQFVYFYFQYFRNIYQIDSIFAPEVTNLPFPEFLRKKLKLESYDHGVDGVIQTSQDIFIAYQVKFRSGRSVPTSTELSTFWSEAEYADHRCVVTNSNTLPKVTSKKLNHSEIKADVFDELNCEFFEALEYYATRNKINKQEKYTPRDFQEVIIQDILSGFRKNKRGKLIAACGIGKTLISLWVKEKMKVRKTLFLAPTLTLVRQTVDAWVRHSNRPFKFICVCSDATVANAGENDTWDNSVESLDIPVTTNSIQLAGQLEKIDDEVIVFCTYQSADVVRDATFGHGFKFDLIVFDEAHRTAGSATSNLFSIALSNEHIRSNHRLFMTATERLVRSNIKSTIEKSGRVIFSMDDEEIYGPTFYRLNFGDAIQKGIISDYRIILAGITEEEIQKQYFTNRFLEEGGSGQVISSQDLFKRLLILKAIQELDLKKIVSFHSSIKESKSFTNFLIKNSKEFGEDIPAFHINGSFNSSQRRSIFQEFENSNRGLLSNVRCLSEGVDIPVIDSVYFSDPRSSLIDIVQAVGRALRKDYGTPTQLSYIIVPIMIDANQNFDDRFENFFNIIQSLRDQDDSLAEWIDELNLSAARGSHVSVKKRTGKVSVLLPDKVDLDRFYTGLVLKIAEVNKNPTGTVGLGSKLGKKQRVSVFKRVFKTLGDYTPKKYEESLVIPTINCFSFVGQVLERKDITINNNNVSHTERLGLIEKTDTKEFALTDLGENFRSGNLKFKQIFQNQMMKYKTPTEEGFIYPYRIALAVLKDTKSINYHEFLYALYSVQPEMSESVVIKKIINDILTFRDSFPNSEITNEANKETILNEMNGNHPVGFSFNDVWTDRTTTGNQYRYLRRHLELFDSVIMENSNILQIVNGSEIYIEEILSISVDDDG